MLGLQFLNIVFTGWGEFDSVSKMNLEANRCDVRHGAHWPMWFNFLSSNFHPSFLQLHGDSSKYEYTSVIETLITSAPPSLPSRESLNSTLSKVTNNEKWEIMQMKKIFCCQCGSYVIKPFFVSTFITIHLTYGAKCLSWRHFRPSWKTLNYRQLGFCIQLEPACVLRNCFFSGSKITCISFVDYQFSTFELKRATRYVSCKKKKTARLSFRQSERTAASWQWFEIPISSKIFIKMIDRLSQKQKQNTKTQNADPGGKKF